MPDSPSLFDWADAANPAQGPASPSPAGASPPAESVSQLTQRISNLLSANFHAVRVEGEITNARVDPARHAYFSIKDEKSSLSCVCFHVASVKNALSLLANGTKVRLQGRITVYPERGSYQLVITGIQAVGLGELMLQLEELKKRLREEGLFDESKKRKWPYIPAAIGVVSSPSGAVIRDILTVTRRRFPFVRIILAPCQVQGRTATPSIVNAIRNLNEMPDPPDVMIIARGGGSLEDLWCFNEEAVVRAVRTSKIPVISAVGHETDTTLCDLAADRRAATPSAAAEIAVPKFEDASALVSHRSTRLSRAIKNAVEQELLHTDSLRRRLTASLTTAAAHARAELTERSPQRLAAALREALSSARGNLTAAPARLSGAMTRALDANRLRLSPLETRLPKALLAYLREQRGHIENLNAKCLALSPRAVLTRGYALVTDPDGKVLSSAKNLSPGDSFRATFSDGSIDASFRKKAPRPTVP